MIATKDLLSFGTQHAATRQGELPELDPDYQGESSATEAAAREPLSDHPEATHNEALLFSAGIADLQKREEHIEALSRSELADGPYDDILTPGDYPPEFLTGHEFRAAAATARKEGKRVMISPRTKPTHASREWLAPRFGKHRVEVVSTAYASTGGPTYRQLFDALWAGDSLYESEFFCQLSPLHDGMNFDQLCEEALTTIMRLTIERVNRLAGVIRVSYGADYSQYDLSRGMDWPSERRDAAQEELDRRIEVISRLMTHAKRQAKDKKHG